MKKILLLATSIIALSSCSEEGDLNITNPSQQNCNCGTVQSDRVSDYSVVIKSDCSGNNKRFYLSQGDWMNAHVGYDFCITNSTGWKTTEDTLTKEESRAIKNSTQF